jgi:hypothetical protein
MSETENASPDFQKWLDGLGAVEEDHLFTPVGAQSEAVTALLVQRAALLERTASDDDEDEQAAGERAVGESYTEARDSLDAQIAAQLEADHPDAPRFRLRGLSDDDFTAVNAEVLALTDNAKLKLTIQQANAEASMRMVQRAILTPQGVTLQDVRVLRKTLNRGEWARLLDHVNRLATADAEATDLPN